MHRSPDGVNPFLGSLSCLRHGPLGTVAISGTRSRHRTPPGLTWPGGPSPSASGNAQRFSRRGSASLGPFPLRGGTPRDGPRHRRRVSTADPDADPLVGFSQRRRWPLKWATPSTGVPTDTAAPSSHSTDSSSTHPLRRLWTDRAAYPATIAQGTVDGDLGQDLDRHDRLPLQRQGESADRSAGLPVPRHTAFMIDGTGRIVGACRR